MTMLSQDMICNKNGTTGITYFSHHFSIKLLLILLFLLQLLSIFTNFITYFPYFKYISTCKQDKISYVLCIFYSKLYCSPTSLILVGSYSEWIRICCYAFFVSDKTRVAEESRNAFGLVPIFCLNALENTSASL